MPQNLQRSGFLALIPSLLQERGVGTEMVLAEAGLDANALDDPEAMIPYENMGLLLDACVKHTDCLHFGLLLGARAGIRSLGLIGQLMANAPSLGVAMRDLVAHQHRHARGSVAYLIDQTDQLIFGYAVYQTDMAAVATIGDGAAAVAFELISRATGRMDKAELTVHLNRPEPENAGPYFRHFGCPIQFGSEFTGVGLPKAWTALSLEGAEPKSRASLENRVETYFKAGDINLVERLRRWLSVGLLTEELDRDMFAEHLGISRRTLNRRLATAGSSYQTVLDECRFELAKQLLENSGLSVGQISVILRYAEHSQFTRAFVRWSGLSPFEWRLGRRPT